MQKGSGSVIGLGEREIMGSLVMSDGCVGSWWVCWGYAEGRKLSAVMQRIGVDGESMVVLTTVKLLRIDAFSSH